MIRRGLKAGLLAVALVALAGCSLLDYFNKKPPSPDTLAKWAMERAVSVGPADTFQANGSETTSTKMTADGKGYEILPEPGRPQQQKAYLYFVPIEALDSSLDATLHKLAFPAGIATVHAQPGPGDMAPAGGDLQKKLSESEIEKFYLVFFIGENAAKCDDFTRPCNATTLAAIVGKLKGQSIFGAKRRFLIMAPGMTIDPEKLMAGHVGDSQTVCGFDSAKDRLPRHIAGGCDALRRMTFAADNDFTLMPGQKGLVPLTPEALKKEVDEFVKEPVYDKGVLNGALMEGQ